MSDGVGARNDRLRNRTLLMNGQRQVAGGADWWLCEFPAALVQDLQYTHQRIVDRDQGNREHGPSGIASLPINLLAEFRVRVTIGHVYHSPTSG